MISNQSKPQTKSATAIKLLNRKKGASVNEICNATGWKPHSVRAFLTGLRKRDFVIVREQRDNDCTAYRIKQGPMQTSAADAA